MLAQALLPEGVQTPAGPFTIGIDDGEQDDRPVHSLNLDAFYLDTFPSI